MNTVPRDWIVEALSTYWPKGPQAVLALPIETRSFDGASLSHLTEIGLPDWAKDCGVSGIIPVPSPVNGADPRESSRGETWRRVDWWGAATWYLSGVSERAHEDAHGPIHSYSFKLGVTEGRAFEHAWVNRIALFLRRWAAHEAGRPEEEVLGPRPRPRLHLTHDIDAVAKTFAIRFKQSAFRGFRAMRLTLRGELRRARRVASSAADFAFGNGTYDRILDVARANESAGHRGIFFVHARRKRRPPVDALLDPGYSLEAPGLEERLRELRSRGHEVGSHPSFSSWDDSDRLAEERSALTKLLGADVRACRQHWMRFSWAKTWAAQERAGFTFDSTLGFNDRPGFRVSAALRHRPWNAGASRTHTIEVLPLVVMDSHLYDYAELDASARTARLRHFIDEVRAVSGEAAILWHPHTLSGDYGWQRGFEEMLAMVGPA